MIICATRFAPSPTGQLHLGHAWSALQAHDFARKYHGHFFLRIEDIDPGRTRGEFVDDIISGLLWLGLAWEGEIIFQSDRLTLYDLALEDLKQRGLVYPCFCTRTDIAASAHAPHGPDGPAYPGTCRMLNPDRRISRMAFEPHCWRLDMAQAIAQAGALTWQGHDKAAISAQPELYGDIVLARKDVPVSYHLAVVVDDAAQAISHVVRGCDLYAATHIHRLLQALLYLPSPIYLHHALIGTSDGQRLAKRSGAPTLASLRAAGTNPVTLITAMREGRLPNGFQPLASRD